MMTPSDNLFRIATIGLLTLGIGLAPALADENPITEPKPLETSTGTSQDLQGLELTTNSSLDSESLLPSTVQFPYEIQEDFYHIKTQTLNLTLESSDNALGDTQRTTRRLPFAQH